MSGLWHGASWNFIIWGAYHGLFLILDRIFLVKFLEKAGKIISIPLTFFIVIIGWVIFRIEELNDIPIYLSKLFDFGTFTIPSSIPGFYIVLPFAIVFSFITISKFGKEAESYIFHRSIYSLKEYYSFTTVSLILLILSVSSITSSGFNPFIYFRF